MLEHLSTSWPQSVERGREVGGVDVVLVDADIYGWATQAETLGSTQADALRTTVGELQGALDQIPSDAQPYFRRLLEIARLTLEVRAEH
jgi:hypothetical protein